MSKSKEKAGLEKRFEFHVRSILPSDSSGEEDNSGKAMKQLAKCSKRESNSKLTRDSDNSIKKNDYPNLNELFEGLEREIMHKTEVNKNIITKVIEEILMIYKRNFWELLCKQKKEIVNLKKKFVDNMHRELEHWEKYINSVKQQEEKLMTVLDQLKDLYRSSPFRIQKVEMVIEMRKDFLQKYEELIKKHKSEAKVLNGAINKEVEILMNNIWKDVNIEENRRKNLYVKNRSVF